MTWDELKAWCLSLPGAEETFPFEPGCSVFKAPNGRMFGVTVRTMDPLHISVKCDPDLGADLRREHASIEPGYHLDKRHWITVRCNEDAPDELVRQLVEDSYALVAPQPRRAVRA